MKVKRIFPDEITQKFLSSLKSLRIKINKTRKEVAEQVGISWITIRDWEKGRCYPSLENLIRLAEFYNHDISESLNYKYFHKTIQYSDIKALMQCCKLSYRELAKLIDSHEHNVSDALRMKDKGSISCLAIALDVLEEECKFKRKRNHERIQRKEY